MKSSKILVTVGSEKLASDKEEQVYSGGALDILAEVPPSTKHDSVDAAIVRAKVRNGLGSVKHLDMYMILICCYCLKWNL